MGMVARRNVAYKVLVTATPLTEERADKLLICLKRFGRQETRRLTRNVLRILDEILAGLEDIEKVKA